MTTIESDIRSIKEGQHAHNHADDVRFEGQDRKLDKILEAVDVFKIKQAENQITLASIKEDTSKTNGRVTNLERTIVEQKVLNAQFSDMLTELKDQNVKLFNLNSKYDWVLAANWERIEKEFEKKEDIKLVKNGFYTICSLIILAVISFWITASVKNGNELLSITRTI